MDNGVVEAFFGHTSVDQTGIRECRSFESDNPAFPLQFTAHAAKHEDYESVL